MKKVLLFCSNARIDGWFVAACLHEISYHPMLIDHIYLRPIKIIIIIFFLQ